ncbi:hypothetical protein C2I18_08890 [Paenibacillus sp. PK3_47]|uniref:AbrB/MazE/SpoVT family DNA-binding domain-containing protein n=1 Tax=Paenibacillus sp. PK3_47 TaxID=2072642 RepID=UPI00201DD127|nr:AbrB/MazE/SpoVT family DNA-binding domain-containing protein [Paenibacillus sp. PK3_47]UQZ33644.1 hypothetical protein C2I18_08890 [Paenibacillus sp. PK3_47]
MLYGSISSAGLITIPKQVRNYLNLPTDGGIIAVETGGKYQIKIYNPLDNSMSFIRKVTKNGQFKLPAPLKEAWGLTEKGEVSFFIQDPFIVVALAGPKIQCAPCAGAGLIYGLTCPICEGEGKTRKSPLGPLIEFAEATRHATKYGMSIAKIDFGGETTSYDVSVDFENNTPMGYRDVVENYLKQLVETSSATS